VASKRPNNRPANRQSTRSSSHRGDTLQSKRERFEEAGKFPLKKVVFVVSVVIVLVVVGGATRSMVQASKRASSGVQVTTQSSAPSSASAGQSGATIDMTPIDLAVAGDTASFAVADVQKATLASLTYKRNTPMPGEWQSITGGSLPLISYVAPSGNLVVATSVCEPCKGIAFHIEGNALVCNTCFTKWDLNTLEGISGGCTAYPPQPLQGQNQNGTIVVNTGDLEKWVPRI
jgi:hypothetical protein